MAVRARSRNRGIGEAGVWYRYLSLYSYRDFRRVAATNLYRDVLRYAKRNKYRYGVISGRY